MNNTMRLMAWIAAISVAVPVGVAGQTTTQPGASVPSTGSSAQVLLFAANLQAFQSANGILAAQQLSLATSGATPAQLSAWQQQNVALIAAHQQQAQALSAQAPSTILPAITDITVPSDASPELTALLTTKISLLNEDIARNNHNQLPTPASSGASSSPLPAADAATMQALAQQAQAVAAQSAHVAAPIPATAFPPGASTRLQAFLSARNQLMKEEFQLYNQYVDSPSPVRDAAMQQWHQANASRFVQLQQMAQTLSSPPN